MKKLALMLCWGAIGLLMCAGPAFSVIGINYSPFHYAGQSPDSSTPIPDSQFIADLQTMATKFKVIRTYGVDPGTRLDQFVPLAAQHQPHVKIWLGVYESKDFNGSADKTFLDIAIHQANTYSNVEAVVVGNECLPGDPIGDNAVSVAQMILDLQYVKNGIHNKAIIVTTDLTWAAGAVNSNGLQLAPYCDVIMANIYPFYGGTSIDNNASINNLINAYKNIFIPRYPGKRIVIGETGWPSAPTDSPIGSAVPSLAHEETFTKQVIANRAHLGDTFLYAAFDEPWGPGGNAWGPHWGIWDQDRNLKFDFVNPGPDSGTSWQLLLLE